MSRYIPMVRGYSFENAGSPVIGGAIHKPHGLLYHQRSHQFVGVQLNTSNNYWSSTEYSSNNARNVNTNNGNVNNNNNKNNSHYVRAFLRVPLSASANRKSF